MLIDWVSCANASPLLGELDRLRVRQRRCHHRQPDAHPWRGHPHCGAAGGPSEALGPIATARATLKIELEAIPK
jgi:hypothetical protein